MELIGQGRDADVFALDDRRVLRRYRAPGPTAEEHRLMAYLGGQGFPVPEVYETTATDMVMQRLDGPTLLALVLRRPWRARRFGRALATLHDRLHGIVAPEWLPAAVGGDGARGRVLHLDLHPGNVIVTAQGPVVIDWRNAAAGEPGLDLAKTLVTVGSADLRRWLHPMRRRFMLGLRESAADPTPWTAHAVRTRLADGNVTASEAARLRKQMLRAESGRRVR